jgi:hypothetical protein
VQNVTKVCTLLDQHAALSADPEPISVIDLSLFRICNLGGEVGADPRCWRKKRGATVARSWYCWKVHYRLPNTRLWSLTAVCDRAVVIYRSVIWGLTNPHFLEKEQSYKLDFSTLGKLAIDFLISFCGVQSEYRSPFAWCLELCNFWGKADPQFWGKG